MLLEILDLRRPDVDLELLADYWTLYRGGRAFRERVRRFLPARPYEDPEVYEHRIQTSHYLNYAGPIVAYFAALLFTGRMEKRADNEAPDDFYDAFEKDCDGAGTPLQALLRDRWTQTLVKQRSWILVDFPRDDPDFPAQTRDEWSERGLGNGYLCPLDEEDVIDWDVDDRGELEWAMVKHVDTRRRDPMRGRDTIIETWTLWTRETWTRWRIEYKKGERPAPKDAAVLVGIGTVATKGFVPLVRIEVPEALWAMNLLASPQLEQTRARNALSFSLARTCYAMRVFKSEDAEARPPVHGPGLGILIGLDEDVKWDAPPADAFEPVDKYAATLKDELYRVAHQMALGVENNAAAIGRTVESKTADNSATEVVLAAMGEIVRGVVERMYNLLSRGRRDQRTWTIKGLDSFDVTDATALADAAVTANTLAIPSPTFRRLLHRRVALAMVPDASQDDRDKIAKEIDENTPNEIVDPMTGLDDEDDERSNTTSSKSEGMRRAAG
jgi:hypothetical protein